MRINYVSYSCILLDELWSNLCNLCSMLGHFGCSWSWTVIKNAAVTHLLFIPLIHTQVQLLMVVLLLVPSSIDNCSLFILCRAYTSDSWTCYLIVVSPEVLIKCQLLSMLNENGASWCLWSVFLIKNVNLNIFSYILLMKIIYYVIVFLLHVLIYLEF